MKHLKSNQILTSNYPYYRYSLDYALDGLQRIGAPQIEFYACFPHFHVDDVNFWDMKSLDRKLKSRNLNPVCFTPEQCLYPVNIAALDERGRTRSRRVFEKSIRFGAGLGAKYVVALAGYGTLDEEESVTWERSVESLIYLGELAQREGVTLVLETAPREYTTTHNSKDVVRMIKEVNLPSVRGMIDTATLGFSGETMKQAIQDLEGNLKYVHIADGVPNGHLIIGDGELNLFEMLQELDCVEYEGPISLEILNDKYVRNPQEAMETSYLRLKKYIEE